MHGGGGEPSKPARQRTISISISIRADAQPSQVKKVIIVIDVRS